jgi:hypothetical protein
MMKEIVVGGGAAERHHAARLLAQFDHVECGFLHRIGHLKPQVVAAAEGGQGHSPAGNPAITAKFKLRHYRPVYHIAPVAVEQDACVY